MPTSSSPEKSFPAALQRRLPSLLPQFLSQQRWFGGKAHTIRSVEVSDIVPFCFDPLRSYFILVRVSYADGPTETYDIPLVHSSGEIGLSSLRIRPDELGEEVVLKDALTDEQFLTHLLDSIASGAALPGARGKDRKSVV